MELEALRRLEEWVKRASNGDWDPEDAVAISTTEHPGWHFSVDLRGLPLQYKPFEKKGYEKSKADWMLCVVENEKFRAWGGLGKLEELIHEFLVWAEG